MKVLRLAALLLAPGILFGQLGTGTVTVTASSDSNPQPDQAILSISVSSGIGQSLDGVVKALASAGVSAANLSSLDYQSNGNSSRLGQAVPQLNWTFQLTVPVAQIKNTTASLSSLARTIAQNNSGLTLSFYVQNTQVSPQLMRNCGFGNLMNNARTEAQSIAGATGFTPGAVVGIAGSIAQSIPGCSLTATFGLPVSRSGPNTITISASRTATPSADQVSIALDVISGLTAGLDDINTALAAAGISGAGLMGVSTEFSQAQSDLDWSFTLTTPLVKLTSTLTQLVAAQAAISKQNSALSFSFYLQNLGTSQQSQPACDEAGLVSDARSQAQTLAAVAGVGVGAILNMSDQPISATPVAVAAFISGDFVSFAGFPSSLQATLAPASTCTLSVQFQLL
jgi:uncharacterized protein YggE